MNNIILVTGSLGLIGSSCVMHFCNQGYNVYGIDNDMRSIFFGKNGSTLKNKNYLESNFENYKHFSFDIRDKDQIDNFFKINKPDSVIHCAAQPSHDLAAKIPFDDFSINANATLNLLEATKNYCIDSPFVFLSTNKVYGDTPNHLSLEEKKTRWDFKDTIYQKGINENLSIDQTKHSIFGCSKLAADILVQEYGKYFSMNTVCLRGGCLTGSNHSSVELHGFLSYLIKCFVAGYKYKVFGYKGKQVRDNIDSSDVARFIEMYIKNPRKGEVYNIGGGKDNSVSILEIFNYLELNYSKKMKWEYFNENRIGDHICYYSDLSKIKSHYPDWKVEIDLPNLIDKIYQSANENLAI